MAGSSNGGSVEGGAYGESRWGFSLRRVRVVAGRARGGSGVKLQGASWPEKSDSRGKRHKQARS